MKSVNNFWSFISVIFLSTILDGCCCFYLWLFFFEKLRKKKNCFPLILPAKWLAFFLTHNLIIIIEKNIESAAGQTQCWNLLLFYVFWSGWWHDMMTWWVRCVRFKIVFIFALIVLNLSSLCGVILSDTSLIRLRQHLLGRALEKPSNHFGVVRSKYQSIQAFFIKTVDQTVDLFQFRWNFYFNYRKTPMWQFQIRESFLLFVWEKKTHQNVIVAHRVHHYFNRIVNKRVRVRV